MSWPYPYHTVPKHDALRHDVEGAALALVRDAGDEDVLAVKIPIQQYVKSFYKLQEK